MVETPVVQGMITRESKSLGPIGALKIRPVVRVQNVRRRRILKRTDVNPIKQFEVVRHTFLGIPTGLEGTLVTDFPNRSFFTTDAEIYIRAVSSGFKWVDRTFETTIEGRNDNRHKFHWGVGLWDMLVRTFWALVSDETSVKGWIKVGRFKKEFDVTKEIPIEHKE